MNDQRMNYWLTAVLRKKKMTARKETIKTDRSLCGLLEDLKRKNFNNAKRVIHNTQRILVILVWNPPGLFLVLPEPPLAIGDPFQGFIYPFFAGSDRS